MKIPENLKKRMKNKQFWAAIISSLAIAIQLVFQLFGVTVDLSTQVDTLLELLNVIFIILIVIGVAVDPTTPGMKDNKNHTTTTESVAEDTSATNKDPTVEGSSGELSSDNKVE